MNARTAVSNHQSLKDDPNPCVDEDPDNAILNRQAHHMRRLVSRYMVSGATLAAVTAHENSYSKTALDAYHLGVVADESSREDRNWLLDYVFSAQRSDPRFLGYFLGLCGGPRATLWGCF